MMMMMITLLSVVCVCQLSRRISNNKEKKIINININTNNHHHHYQLQQLEVSSTTSKQLINELREMSAPAYYELYRRSTIGVTLTDALDTLISDEKIQPQLANRILNNFDRIIAENLKNENNLAKSKLVFKGDLDTYRFCDDVWTFIIKNVIIKLNDVSKDTSSNSNSNNNDSSNTTTSNSSGKDKDKDSGDLELNVDKFKIVACNSRKAGDI
ncbi:transcription initiation factor IIA small chain [Candida tropicalis MYA-3404]|uniref:Transcription initiation factor IIA subunit 2 n=1 Tax=Candida tropicalis (strain ATCC MYA-3404 / T1) TaxID=294747 RepID=C5M2B5_CANTT|nr:transcription initiation factor IIA small chain [Candida tropicalis MYA-3404]EER35465.1 transcription initiation factor IIA small chain [Candida tropicalis MYA-3404]KAG4409571.1 hypothetical protein JTP64_000209 [Candida tropicalis]